MATQKISDKNMDFKLAIMLTAPYCIPHKSRQAALRLGKFFANHLNCSKTSDAVLDAQDNGAIVT